MTITFYSLFELVKHLFVSARDFINIASNIRLKVSNSEIKQGFILCY